MKGSFFYLLGTLILSGMISKPVFAHSETCNCSDELEFLSSYIERNHAAFRDNVNDNNRNDYESFVLNLKNEIQKDPVVDHCIIYLKRFLAYFKDNHTQINDRGFVVDENQEEALKQFFASVRFQQRERVEFNSQSIASYLNSEEITPVEGIYESLDGTYTVAVLQNQNNFRDYYGIILESNTRLWEPGQVKFELKEIAENRFLGHFYYKFYNLNTEEVEMKGNTLGSWKKKGTEDQENQTTNSPNQFDQKLFEFKKLKDDVGYFSLKSFDGYLKNQLDSLIIAHEQDLINISKLIIDVRGNGGGSDALLAPFIPFFYTDTLKTELPQLYATKDNLKTYSNFYEQIVQDSVRYGRSTLDYLEKLIHKMELAGEGEFVNMFDSIEELGESMEINVGSQQFVFTNSMSEDKRYRLTYYEKEKSLPSYPEKIVVLMDRGCASTCENLILLAGQSKKVITFGLNSGGYKGYGNVFSVQTPMGYQLGMSTTRYEEGSQYEFIGIPPLVLAQENEDWIQRAIELLELQ